MRIDYVKQSSWDLMNSKIQRDLGLEDKSVLLFAGVNHALYEISASLVRAYPHKIKGYYFKNMDPYFEGPMINLSKEGFDIEPTLFKGQLDKVQNEFLENFQKNSLFTLVSHHDPFFSRRQQTDELIAALNEHKHFTLQVYHNSPPSLDELQQKSRFECSIVSVSPGLAVAVLGGRMKISPVMAKSMLWTEKQAQEVVRFLSDVCQEQKEKIIAFEGKGIAGSSAYFSDEQRLYDRAVIYWTDMDATALLQHILADDLKEPGLESRLETMSLSRWGGMKTTQWLTLQGVDPKVIRGSLIVDANVINENLESQIVKAREEILQLQKGH